jgi:hypothetical protein
LTPGTLPPGVSYTRLTSQISIGTILAYRF